MTVYHMYKKKILSLLAMIIAMLLLVPVAKGNEYTDPQGRYSIWYPVGWTQSDFTGVDIVFLHPFEDEFRENINIVSAHVSNAKNSESYVRDGAEDAIKELKNQFPDIIVVENPETHLINEHWAASYVIDMENQGMTIRESQTLIVSEGYSYIFIITCAALKSDFISYKSYFDKSVNSFEILNEPSKKSLFGGLIITIIVGAIIGGIAGGIVAGLVYVKMKKSKPIEVEPVEVEPIYETITQPIKPLENRKKPPPLLPPQISP